MSHTLLPFILFALAASISPGPTNLLILAHGAQRGLRASVGPILAACCAASAVVLLVGLGLGELLLRYPKVQHAMSWVGALWLSWMAWRLLRAAGAPLRAGEDAGLSPLGAATLQLVNPKVWVTAVAMVGLFATPALSMGWLALVFLLIALPSMTAWALLGVGSARWLYSPRRLRGFNQGLAGLLLVSAWSALLI